MSSLAIEIDNAMQQQQHQAWLRRLEELRNSVGTDKTVPSTEAILDELRAERGE